MKILLLALIVSVVFIIVSTSPSTAGPTEIIAFEYPPYVNRDGTGILDRIVNEALKDTGETAKILVYPRKRAMMKFSKQGNKTQLFIGEKLYFPDLLTTLDAQKLLFVRTVLVCLKENLPSFTFTNMEDLKGKSIAVSRGTIFSPAFQKAGLIVEEASLGNNVKKLKNGRVDFWHTTYATAINLINTHYPDQQNAFALVEDRLPFSVEVIVKKGTPVEAVYQKICAGLETILKNGRYKQIMEEFYGMGQVPEAVMIK